jgi:hypothetical protein
MVLLTLPILGATSGAAGKAPTLVSLTVAGPSGFKSDPTDQTSGGRTGRINIGEASSADCDPTTLSPAQWVGSVLRYFDNDAARPDSYLILCVTQFRTVHEATAAQSRILALDGSSAIRLKDIPDAYLHATGPAEQISFAKGVYLVHVVSTDLEGTAMGLTLGQNLTAREYARLPK